MGILSSATLAEVLDLHDRWKERNIHCGFSGFGEVMSLEYILVL